MYSPEYKEWYLLCDSFLRKQAVIITTSGIESILKVTREGGVTHLNPFRDDNYIIMLVSQSYRGEPP